MTRVIPPDAFDEAVQALRRGQLVVFPTDTVYGVAALAENAEAVARIYAAKNRPRHMAIPVMVAEPDRATDVARPLPGFWALAEAFWPGPLTIILPKTEALSPIVAAGGDTVALRIPDHPLALALLRAVDRPLAVTSANLSGQPPTLTAEEARDQLEGRVAIIVDGGRAPGGQPSTILDLTSEPLKILRPGPITWPQIAEALKMTR